MYFQHVHSIAHMHSTVYNTDSRARFYGLHKSIALEKVQAIPVT